MKKRTKIIIIAVVLICTIFIGALVISAKVTNRPTGRKIVVSVYSNEAGYEKDTFCGYVIYSNGNIYELNEGNLELTDKIPRDDLREIKKQIRHITDNVNTTFNKVGPSVIGINITDVYVLGRKITLYENPASCSEFKVNQSDNVDELTELLKKYVPIYGKHGW